MFGGDGEGRDRKRSARTGTQPQARSVYPRSTARVPAPRRALVLVAVAELLATSPWFSATAAANLAGCRG